MDCTFQLSGIVSIMTRSWKTSHDEDTLDSYLSQQLPLLLIGLDILKKYLLEDDHTMGVLMAADKK